MNDPNANELTLYFTAGVISGKEDPIMWWKDNRDQFPPPTKLAREYLAIITYTCNVHSFGEKFFTAGYISGQRRCRLSVEHVNQLVFLSKSI